MFVISSNPGGGFGASVRYQVGGGSRSVVSTDINGDAKPDLISASFRTGSIAILLGKGDGDFNQPVNLPVFSPLQAVFTAQVDVIATGDFDADGAIDLAVSQGGSNLITALKNRSICVPARPEGILPGGDQVNLRLQPSLRGSLPNSGARYSLNLLGIVTGAR
jgi:FG-GAP-like repeat